MNDNRQIRAYVVRALPKLIVVGIPTWCEAGTIRAHVERVDQALSLWAPNASVAIVNADNSSPDGTAREFLAARSRHRKILLRTNNRGKGHNILCLFKFCIHTCASVLVTLDADLEVLPDDWLPQLGNPVLESRAELVLPLYARTWYDGNMTNQFMAPWVSAVTGLPIRQPMGGEFAFSRRAMTHLVTQDWPTGAYQFGVDLFAVLRCVGSGLQWTQALLSTGKFHSWRSDTAEEVEAEMALKFRSMIETILGELVDQKWSTDEQRMQFPIAPALGRLSKNYDVSQVLKAAKHAYEIYKGLPAWRALSGPTTGEGPEIPKIDDELWVRILASVLRLRKTTTLRSEHYACLKALFFVRLATVLPYLRERNDMVEPMVQRLADLLTSTLKAR